MSSSIDRFSGFADIYDANRPQPPVVIADILSQVAGADSPKVVDVGCGTGLSTRIWAEKAERVIGIEPNSDMRDQARNATISPNITYAAGTSTQTGMQDGSVDIVTASQSFHWMEPQPSLTEFARILRTGGVFATIDCDWPPTINPAVETAYSEFTKRTHELEEIHGVSESVSRWSKNEHLKRIRESGLFCFTKEILVHSIEPGSVDRLCGLALSFGGVAALLKLGLSEEDIGLDVLRAAAEAAMGDEQMLWYFSYRVRFGVK